MAPTPPRFDLKDRSVLITGANRGLGAALCKTILQYSPKIIHAGYRKTPGDFDDPRISWCKLDIQRTDSIAAAVASIGELDVLINNAGALFNDYAETEEGIERSAALLLLSPWKLTESLLPLLQDHARAARVINVVSGGMYTQKLRCDELIMTADKYNGSVAYARAKRALTVLSELWAKAWAEHNIAVNSMHPGWADTPGVQTALPGFRRLTKRVLRSPAEGADTIVWLARATEADQVSGKLFLDRESRTTHLRNRTQERPEERARLLDWLAETYSGLNLNDKG